MAYFSLTGPKENRRLDVRNQRSGDAVQLIPPAPGAWGAVQRAALSPDMQRLAFAVLNDGKGTWSLYVARLSDGTTTALGETEPRAFGDRLLWSQDGRYLAFTITRPGVWGCEVLPCPSPGPGSSDYVGPGSSDVWIYEVGTGAAMQVTHVGNAFVASWSPTVANTEMLWMGRAAADPSSVAVKWDAAAGLHAFDVTGTDAAETKKGAFLPLLSPNGMNAIYWRGTMQFADAGWTFASGGLPCISGVKDGIPLWSDDPLFDDLTVTGPGDGFTSGSVTWSADSEAHAFWGGLWPGIPQPAGYPDPNAVYVGYAAAGHYHLNKDSRVAYGPPNSDNYLVDVALSPDGTMAALTLGVPTPEFGASALLQLMPVAGDGMTNVGSNQPAWNGPAVFVPAN
jgi:hypothetical protein